MHDSGSEEFSRNRAFFEVYLDVSMTKSYDVH